MSQGRHRPDPRKNPLPRGKVEIHKVKLHDDPELDHCWVPFVDGKPLEFENKCTSVDSAKDRTALHFHCLRDDLRFAIIS